MRRSNRIQHKTSTQTQITKGKENSNTQVKQSHSQCSIDSQVETPFSVASGDIWFDINKQSKSSNFEKQKNQQSNVKFELPGVSFIQSQSATLQRAKRGRCIGSTGKVNPYKKTAILSIESKQYESAPNPHQHDDFSSNKRAKSAKTKDEGKSSIYSGVCWVQARSKWRARVRIPHKGRVHLGYFLDESEAARAYDKRFYQQYKKTEGLNFPNEYQKLPVNLSDDEKGTSLPGEVDHSSAFRTENSIFSSPSPAALITPVSNGSHGIPTSEPQGNCHFGNIYSNFHSRSQNNDNSIPYHHFSCYNNPVDIIYVPLAHSFPRVTQPLPFEYQQPPQQSDSFQASRKYIVTETITCHPISNLPAMASISLAQNPNPQMHCQDPSLMIQALKPSSQFLFVAPSPKQMHDSVLANHNHRKEHNNRTTSSFPRKACAKKRKPSVVT